MEVDGYDFYYIYILGFQSDDGDLGHAEFEQERLKKESREQLPAIRKIVQAEVPEAQQGQSSTLLNKVAKRLLRLSVGTLLFGGGEALSLPYNMESNAQCFVSVETTEVTTPWTIFFLVSIIVVLVIAVMTLLKIMYVMHLRIEATREAMDWVRTQWRQSRDRRMIREEEQQRLGVWLNDTDEESESGDENEEFQEEEQLPGEEQPTMNGAAHIRRMTLEEFNNGMEEGGEFEMEEIEVEVDPGAEAGGDRAVPLGDGAYDFDFDVDSISIHGEGPSGECKMEQEQEEEESDDDMETDYGSVGMVDEDFSVFENLEPTEYDDYRFIVLSESRGVEHYIVRKLSYLVLPQELAGHQRDLDRDTGALCNAQGSSTWRS